MADGESICKYVGLGVIILVVIYVVSRSLNFQAKLVEGLTTDTTASTSVDNDDVPANIASNNSSLEDTLLIEKYRSSYEDTIINLEKNVSLKILQLVTENATLLSSDSDAQDKITLANNLQQFKETLNSTMLFMDGMKSTGKFGLF